MGYVDPNTGGMLFQALAAGFAVVSGLILIFSRQIRTGFARARRFVRERFARERSDGSFHSTK